MGSLAQLCEYSSSDEEDLPPISRLPLPNLPSYGVPKSIAREPQECNRAEKSAMVRNFPHEPGNWATFVAIPVNLPSETTQVFENLCKSLASLNVEKVEDYHISLTRVLVLRHHWISEFIKTLEQVISAVPTFTISLKGISVYLNDNNTKTFIALNIQHGEDIINELIDNVDKCLEEYNLPIFYLSRSLHLSVLWCLGNVKEQVEEAIKHITLNSVIPIYVDHCFCKSGNKFFNFTFAR